MDHGIFHLPYRKLFDGGELEVEIFFFGYVKLEEPLTLGSSWMYRARAQEMSLDWKFRSGSHQYGWAWTA